jgi:hypothetical protein
MKILASVTTSQSGYFALKNLLYFFETKFLHVSKFY